MLQLTSQVRPLEPVPTDARALNQSIQSINQSVNQSINQSISLLPRDALPLLVPGLGTVFLMPVCHIFTNISSTTESTFFRQYYPDIILR